MDLLLKNGTVVDPKNNINGIFDVFIKKGVVVEVKKNLKVSDVKVIDCKGKIVAPGFIDMHVHLREPGYEFKEDITSGSHAAVRGGFTSVACMPNTEPAIDNASIVYYIQEKSREANLCNVFPVGSITKGRGGNNLAAIGELVEAGVVAISDDGTSVLDAGLMRKAMDYAKMFDIVILDHCEDATLAADGVMNEGYYSTILGLTGIPACSEDVIVGRDIALSEYTGARIHICHLSTKGSVELVRQAKKRGVKVTAEVAPHHIALDESALESYNTSLKVNPPLRTKDDIKAIKKGLKDGTIDAIATDHAPHAKHEKLVEFNYAPFGMIGLETALSVVLTETYHKKVLSISQIVEKLSTNPASILKLENKGSLSPEADADIVVFDSDQDVMFNEDSFASKSNNSPFIGHKLKGKICMTLVGGRVVYKDNKF